MLHSRKHRNSKFTFYASGILGMLVPRSYYRAQLDELLVCRDENVQAELDDRVRYYMKSDAEFEPSADASRLSEIPSTRFSSYYFDFRRVMRYFPDELKFDYKFGDQKKVPPMPTLLKSRPICDDNSNSILLKLNTVRHYLKVADPMRFADKKNQLVWRGKTKPHRMEFVTRFHDHEHFDVGPINQKSESDVPYRKPYLSISEQLKYKFVMSIEGNDVATNLKWIMMSNSLCFMRRPRFETWFMEARLVPDEHYVLLRDDYSDTEEKVNYYLDNPDAAQHIIDTANKYVQRFHDDDLERLVSLHVLSKYFHHSGQL